MKKLLCVLMALTMVLSMSVVAFAAEPVTSVEDFNAALATGEVTLGADIEIDERLVIEADESLIINLNGYKLTTKADASNYDILVKGSLTINGNDNAASAVHISGAYGIGLSTACTGGLTINGGIFTSADETVYMIGGFGGKVVINGGFFETPYCVVNSFDGYSCPVEISDGKFVVTGNEETSAPILGGNDTTGEIKVSGGSFSESIPTEYVAEGCCVKECDSVWTVAKHSIEGWKTDKSATCTLTGTEIGSCANCGETETRTVSAKGHSFEEVEGKTVRVCSVCGAEEAGVTIIHNEVEENPSTGAPVVIPVMAVLAALTGAVISKRK